VKIKHAQWGFAYTHEKKLQYFSDGTSTPSVFGTRGRKAKMFIMSYNPCYLYRQFGNIRIN
jgi:hypothetical protein